MALVKILSRTHENLKQKRKMKEEIGRDEKLI